MLKPLLLFAGLAIFIFFSCVESHHFNWRYLLWKWTALPVAGAMRFQFLNVDTDWIPSLTQKTRAELQRWYPENIPASQGTESYQVQSLPSMRTFQESHFSEAKEPEWVWLNPTTNWAALFSGEKVLYVGLFKG